MGITTSVWPINENNEIVTSVGTGSRNVSGYIAPTAKYDQSFLESIKEVFGK